MANAPAVSTPDEATTPDPSPTGVTGLSSAEAARRLARDGANALPRPVRIRQRLFVQLRDPLIVVLLIAAALTIATGDWADSTVIFLVAVLNRCGDHWAPSHSVPPIYSSWRVCGARIRRGALGKLLFPARPGRR